MSWPFLKHKLAGTTVSKSFVLIDSVLVIVAGNLEIKHELATSASLL
jgi:hypothetical protein